MQKVKSSSRPGAAAEAEASRLACPRPRRSRCDWRSAQCDPSPRLHASATASPPRGHGARRPRARWTSPRPAPPRVAGRLVSRGLVGLPVVAAARAASCAASSMRRGGPAPSVAAARPWRRAMPHVARRSSRPRESSRAGRSPLLLAPCCKMNCPPPLPPSAWPPGPIREWRFPARRGCEAPLLRGCSPARRPPPPGAHVAPARPRPAFPAARLPLAAAARPRPRRSPRKRATSCPSFFRGARMYALWTTIGFQSKTIADFRVPSIVTCPRFRYPLPWRTR